MRHGLARHDLLCSFSLSVCCATLIIGLVVWYITFRCKIYILYQVRCSYIHLPLEVPGTWYIRQAAVTLISRPAVYVVKYLVCISTTTRKKIKPKYYHYILRTTLVAATSKTTKQQPGEVMHRQVVPSRIREDQASLGVNYATPPSAHELPTEKSYPGTCYQYVLLYAQKCSTLLIWSGLELTLLATHSSGQ